MAKISLTNKKPKNSKTKNQMTQKISGKSMSANQKKGARPRKAIFPVKTSEAPASQKQLEFVRGELKENITSLRLEMKSEFRKLDSKFLDIDSRFSDMNSRFLDFKNEQEKRIENIEKKVFGARQKS